jgi:hypothetical protein
MLISHYLIFENDHVVPNFNYGIFSYVTVSTSSRYLSKFRPMENKNDDYNDDDNF